MVSLADTNTQMSELQWERGPMSDIDPAHPINVERSWVGVSTLAVQACVQGTHNTLSECVCAKKGVWVERPCTYFRRLSLMMIQACV